MPYDAHVPPLPPSPPGYGQPGVNYGWMQPVCPPDSLHGDGRTALF
jgi:hypothetical protein